MTDEQFNEFLRDLSQEYHQPPDVPREAMWTRIESARREARRPASVTSIAPPWLGWGVGVAAALVIGVAIGMRINMALTTTDQRVASAATEDNGAGDSTNDVVRLVALEHLSRTAGFLTLFRADARSGRLETDVAEAARDMLATTRLLQGSSASLDPHVVGLLDDLELVLVQIAQLRGDNDAEERDFITQGIEQRDMLLKLRSATSDQAVLPGIQGVL